MSIKTKIGSEIVGGKPLVSSTGYSFELSRSRFREEDSSSKLSSIVDPLDVVSLSVVGDLLRNGDVVYSLLASV
jgi:hypothetical protein